MSQQGQQLYMDFGFMISSSGDFSKLDLSKDQVVESFDGYSSYLLIVDEVSKCSRIFMTKTKEPPIESSKIFMKQFANADGGLISCNQGGELV